MENPKGHKRQHIVIGGGAAGFFGAIACAENDPQAEVHLFEASRQVLAKVRISGGGRCNVTHNCFDPSLLVKGYPRGAKELRGPFSQFQPADTVKWFEGRGVKLKAEPDGRMFPVTDRSSTVIECLVNSASRAGVKVHISSPVKEIVPLGPDSSDNSRYEVRLKSGETYQAHSLLIATGSHASGYRFAENLGHQLEPRVPSLFTFKMTDSRLKDLAGLSFEKAHLKLSFSGKGKKLDQEGPVLITHWGLSGPAVLKLSAFGARPLFESKYQAQLIINWLSGETLDSIRETLESYKEQHPKRQVLGHNPFPALPKRFWQRLAQLAGVNEGQPWAEQSKKVIRKLAEEIGQGRYEVRGKGVFKDEFVTCGGVKLKEVNFKTMESKKLSGLYFAGEVLNIDGITGGFNFQNAWTTSWIAGHHMARN